MQTGNFLPGAAAGRAVPWLSPPVPAAQRQPWPWSPHPSPVAAHYEQHGSTAASSPHPCTLPHPTAPLCTPLCPPPGSSSQRKGPYRQQKSPSPNLLLPCTAAIPNSPTQPRDDIHCCWGTPAQTGLNPTLRWSNPQVPTLPSTLDLTKSTPGTGVMGNFWDVGDKTGPVPPPAPSSTGSS